MENSESGVLDSERGGIVTARGTGDGLVIRLDGRVELASLKEALNDFMVSRRAFLTGNEVVLEWVGRLPEQGFIDELSRTLLEEFEVTVKASRLREQKRVGMGSDDGEGIAAPIGGEPADKPAILSVRSVSMVSGAPAAVSEGSEGTVRRGSFRKERSREAGSGSGGGKDGGKRYSLFDGIEVMSVGDGDSRGIAEGAGAISAPRERGRLAVNPLLWDDPDARIIDTTLRSGQRVDSDHSVIIFGDVNSGAEVVAGGDIVVLGTLRGVAHAGAYDETGGGRIIFALTLAPTQLRIGSVISRGQQNDSSKFPEVARIEGNIISVEAYQARAFASRR